MEIKAADLLNLPRVILVGAEYYKRLFGKEDFDFAYSLSRWAGAVKDGNGVAFYVEHEGRIVGMICALAAPNIDTGKLAAAVQHWYVDPDAAGYGVRLLWKVKQWAKEKGCSTLVLTCSAQTWDERHKALYERMGYKDHGRKYILEMQK